ncbi:uncharacterized protein LOC133825743 [Humulus lupulus]|uniref:uncharacterized protein LOC133825743 n=1 Tax=Humulus lupulus TaxID=3486 RepID=UPI002B417DCF|nr:uncharacterized protein LOC133825743 [Humulus lupulus]
MGFEGARYTWCNRHANGTFTQERLDKMICKNKWSTIFPKSYMSHLKLWGHRPILTRILREKDKREYPKAKSRFHFEMAWENEEECKELVRQTWGDHGNTTIEELRRIILGVSKGLKDWNLSSFRRTQIAMKKKEEELANLDNALDNASWEKYRNDEHELDVTSAKNRQLMREFSEVDVKEDSFQMHPRKSPGKDDMGTSFYQKFWEFVGDDVCKACLSFINGSDNAMVGFECLNAIKRHKKGKTCYCSFKPDMAKAYDRVDWNFLWGIIEKLGFNSAWIGLIEKFISFVKYSININSAIIGKITPTRGLRQGDPLSSFLFLLCVEDLSSLLKHALSTDQVRGLKCGLGGPMVSHLFFADDIFFFLEATMENCTHFKEILVHYENPSGYLVNLNKFVVCFLPQMSPQMCDVLALKLGVPLVPCHEKYLGLPCFAGKSENCLFQPIRDGVWNKLFSWKSKFFSAGGREVLLKSIIQAIPTICYELIHTICFLTA